MNQKLKKTDILGLGLMVFSFFLGAGNLIFPPLAGQLAGNQVGWSLFGFTVSSVLLPLLATVAVARGGDLPEMLRELPNSITRIAILLVFALMGPLFVTPRAGIVVYEMVFRPLLADDSGSGAQCSITLLFFIVTLIFCWNSGTLIDNIGKVVTPILFLLLVGLAVALVLTPLGSVQAPQADYITAPFAQGLFAGYQTMDTFGSLMFGGLIIGVLRSKGITDSQRSCRYLVIAGGISAVGLFFAYLSLFWLGATSAAVAPGALCGSTILTAAVQMLFGSWGQWLLGIVVVLACLTTAVGLLSAFADHLAGSTTRSYHFWIVVSSIISAMVANIELGTLTRLSQPFLFALYPLAVALVALTLMRRWLPNPIRSYRTVMGVTLIFGLMDALRIAGLDMCIMNFLPGFEKGLGWVLPMMLPLAVSPFFPAPIVQSSKADDHPQGK